MYNSFLSIVVVVNQQAELDQLARYFQQLHPVLRENFSDFEFVLVNNTPYRELDRLSDTLPPDLRQNIYLINLSSQVNRNHATMAGLDRANGDYTVIFEQAFMDEPELLLRLFEKVQEGNDIVYLQARERKSNWLIRPLYGLFYYIIRRYSELKVDPRAHDTRIISRRALNSLLRLRENLRYMKAIYALVGYPTAALEVEKPMRHYAGEGLQEQFRSSLVAITSFTSFLRSLLLWIFLFSLLFLGVVIFNALKVKLTNVDIFGAYHEAVSGWTFLVVLISIFFAITCLNLYIMSIYLSNIYYEIKQRPLYLIESVRRL